MATNSTPVALPQLPAVASSYPRKKYVVNASNLKYQGGAYTQVDFILDVFPPGSVMIANRIKHTTAVGGGAISASTARLYWGTQALGAGALDVFAAVGTTDGTHSIAGVTPYAADQEASVNLLMRVTSTTADLSAVTAGEIHAWVEVVAGMGE